MKTKNLRLNLNSIGKDSTFSKHLKIWNTTKDNRRLDCAISEISSEWDGTINTYVGNCDANNPLEFRLKPILQSVMVPPHNRGEEVALYPDRQYAESVMIPNFLSVLEDKRPVFRRIMASMQGRFAIYESLHLPYFGSKGDRNSIVLSRALLQVEGVDPLMRPNLSERERQCLDYLAQGLSAKQIAATLGLSRRTVEHRIETMKFKLGVRTIPHAVAKDLVISMGDDGADKLRPYTKVNGVRLSPRETQCLSLVLSGRSSRDIAAELGISDRSVEDYIASLRIKIGARNVAELAAAGLGFALESMNSDAAE